MKYSHDSIDTTGTLGNLVETHDFNNSVGESYIRVLASNGSDVVFGGHFFESIQMGNEVLETMNSTLFYGELKKPMSSAIVPQNTTEKCDFSVQFFSDRGEFTIGNANGFTAEIFDVRGRRVRDFNLNTDFNSLNVSSLASGAYLLRLNCEYGVQVFPFVR